MVNKILPIQKIADKLGIPEDYLDYYGKYTAKLKIEEKIETIAKEIYGASSVYLESDAREKVQKFTELGFSHLAICMAKTQFSLSDDPKLLGAPKNWTLTVTDAHLAAGAGFIVVVAGNMLLMPGLSNATLQVASSRPHLKNPSPLTKPAPDAQPICGHRLDNQ